MSIFRKIKIALGLIGVLILIWITSRPSLAGPPATSPVNSPEFLSLRDQGDQAFKAGAYERAYHFYKKAEYEVHDDASEDGNLYRIASAASKSGHIREGMFELSLFLRRKPSLSGDPDITQIERALLNWAGEVDEVQSVADVDQLFKRADAASSSEERMGSFRAAREKLRPYLSDPWQDSIQIWRRGALLAIGAGDDWLAAVCFARLNEIYLRFFRDSDFDALIADLKKTAGEREAFFTDIADPNTDDPDEPESVRQLFSNDRQLTRAQFENPFGDSLSLARAGNCLANRKIVLPDAGKAEEYLDQAYTAWANAGFPKGQLGKEIWRGYGKVRSVLPLPFDSEEINEFEIRDVVEKEARSEIALQKPDLRGDARDNDVAKEVSDFFTSVGENYATRNTKLHFIIGDRPADAHLAETWLIKATEVKLGSENDHSGTWYDLGSLYWPYKTDDKDGVHLPDGAKSLYSYLKSGEAGNGEAMRNAGAAYYNGASGERNRFEACRCYRRALELGYKEAATDLNADEMAVFAKWDKW